ncbi:hypothetical protein FBUS_02278 [Fasciolopsis buskii]|uniref:Uncharacterized protein n=1 Tax=Fasciolopsis buskii TaxID=27845 RepID=A0A8E0RNE6_9TREM|nr:hypothetical protein FBUS_02278 [Fasciolopsis buski]
MHWTYKYMLDILPNLDLDAYNFLRTETRKTAFFDGTLYALFGLSHEVWFYVYMYASPNDTLYSGFLGDVTALIACSYMFTNPLLGLILRQASYSPLVDAVLPPPDFEQLRKTAPKEPTSRMRSESANETQAGHPRQQ